MNEREKRSLDELWEELEKARQAEREETKRQAAKAERARDEEQGDNK